MGFNNGAGRGIPIKEFHPNAFDYYKVHDAGRAKWRGPNYAREAWSGLYLANDKEIFDEYAPDYENPKLSKYTLPSNWIVLDLMNSAFSDAGIGGGEKSALIRADISRFLRFFYSKDLDSSVHLMQAIGKLNVNGKRFIIRGRRHREPGRPKYEVIVPPNLADQVICVSVDQ